MKIFTTLAAVLFLSTSIFAQVSDTEKDALIDLYTITNGTNWNTSWDITTPVNQWHGVVVKENKVVSIDLKFNNLTGVLPASISKLHYLENLELSFNQIQGIVPSAIGSLKNLRTFAINGNQITGTIPASIGNLKQLEELHVSSNNLSGSIPSNLGQLKNLAILNVFDNNLTGTIPYTLTASNNLEQLIIAENDIIVTDAVTDVLLFKEDNENTRFKTPNSFVKKTVIAIETSDDDK